MFIEILIKHYRNSEFESEHESEFLFIYNIFYIII